MKLINLQPQTEAPEANREQLSRSNKQRGFTLMELMVIVGILGVIAAFAMSTADTSSSKATRLYNDMSTTKGALLRAKMDMGAFPTNLTALWVKANASSANMYGGLNGTTSWNGAYMESQPVDSSNAIKIVAIADTTTFNNVQHRSRGSVGSDEWRQLYVGLLLACYQCPQSHHLQVLETVRR